MDALADDETLGGAGVARDGSAELDVLVADLTAAEAEELGEKVWLVCFSQKGYFQFILFSEQIYIYFGFGTHSNLLCRLHFEFFFRCCGQHTWCFARPWLSNTHIRTV
jgi:hypothetical protein